jgi:gliding motility-associated-like protein
VNSSTLDINGVPTNFNNYQYACILNGCGPQDTSLFASLSFTPLLLDLQPTDQELCGTKTILLKTNATNANSYQWQTSLDSGLTFVNLNSNAVYQNVTSSELNILSADASFNGLLFRCLVSGCGQITISDTAKIFIKYSAVDDFVPNIFTPNNDGQNDFFELNVTGLNSLSGAIFNRWGQEIFKWNTISDKWDGKFNGNVLNDGVYFYTLSATSECDGRELKKNGTISLFK